jgi:anti-anti-sigma regulatory factor
MLGKLLVLRKKMEAKGGKLKLYGVGSVVHEVLHITKFDQILDIRANRADALQALA